MGQEYDGPKASWISPIAQTVLAGLLLASVGATGSSVFRVNSLINHFDDFQLRITEKINFIQQTLNREVVYLSGQQDAISTRVEALEKFTFGRGDRFTASDAAALRAELIEAIERTASAGARTSDRLDRTATTLQAHVAKADNGWFMLKEMWEYYKKHRNTPHGNGDTIVDP